MRKTIKSIAALALVAFYSSSLYAPGSSNGTVYNITTQGGDGNVAFFSVMGVHAGTPACATSGRWAFTSTTGSGQSMLADVLTAYGSGKTVAVVGTGDCSVWPDSETVSFFVAQ